MYTHSLQLQKHVGVAELVRTEVFKVSEIPFPFCLS